MCARWAERRKEKGNGKRESLAGLEERKKRVGQRDGLDWDDFPIPLFFFKNRGVTPSRAHNTSSLSCKIAC